MSYKDIYESWLNDKRLSSEARAELENIKNNKEAYINAIVKTIVDNI